MADPKLIRVCEDGDIRRVRMLISAGANVNVATKYGRTALASAAYNGCTDVVHMLIDAGANLDKACNNGWTALRYAAGDGRADVVRMLVDAGANLDKATKNGWTALMSAAFKGHTDVVRMLIDAGANLDLVDNDGWTALTRAAGAGHTDVVRILIDAGARIFTKDKENYSALDLASIKGHNDVKTELEAAIKDLRDGSPAALFRAIKSGNIDGIKLAIDNRKASVRGTDGCTLIMAAVENNQEDIVKLILFRGEDTSRTVAERDDTGKTALHCAAKTGNVAVARLLLVQGADPRARDSDGVTPITVAAANGNLDLLRALLQHIERAGSAGMTNLSSSGELISALTQAIASEITSADAIERVVNFLLETSLVGEINAIDESGCAALHAAASRSEGARIVEILISHGADVNLQTRNSVHRGDRAMEGDAPLHLAARNGHFDIVRVLLNHPEIQIDLRNQDGQTPLLCSIKNDHAEIAITLIEAGADVNASDPRDESALLQACRHQSQKVVKTLLQHGARVDSASCAGETPLGVVQSQDIRSVLELYQSSQQFHDRSLALLTKAATGLPPTSDQLMDLVPLITSVYDLRLVLTLGSTLDQPKAMAQADTSTSKLLNESFGRILAQKLVLDDDACVYFRLVLEHCVDSQLLAPAEYMKWKVQATKVNVESAEWVVELKKHVNENSRRFQAHDQAIRTVVEAMHDMHVAVMENRNAVIAVSDRVTHLQGQVDIGKRLLDELMSYTNQLAGGVGQLQQRLTQCEANIKSVASHIQSLQTAYVKRLEQEERVRKKKAVCGLLASIVGFLFAPALKTAFDSVIDLTNPIEIFTHAYQEKDIVQFLVDKTWDDVLKPEVQGQLEKFAIPSDEFETTLRQEIIVKKPELVAECERRGLTVSALDMGSAAEIKALAPPLAKDETALADIIKELEVATATLRAEASSSQKHINSVSWSARGLPTIAPIETSDAATAAIHTKATSLFNATGLQPWSGPIETTNAVPLFTPAGPSGDAGKTGDAAVNREPQQRASIATSTSLPLSSSKVTSFTTLRDGEVVALVDDLDMFPYHLAVHSSHGDLEEFVELTEVINDEVDGLNTATRVWRTKRETQSVLVNAAEYAHLLGYRELVEVVSAEMEQRGVSSPNTTLISMCQASVTLLDDIESFPFVLAVRESEGDVNEYKLLTEVIDYEADAIDAKIRAEIDREELIGEEMWSPIELACHLGYVDIVKHLLVEKRVKTESKSIVVLLRAKQRAKTLAA